jgi:tetratricopeptide (TPR) repeat protein
VLRFTFTTRLPVADPRQRGLTRVVVPITPDFWTREAKPVIPDLRTSKLIRSVTVADDGIRIETRDGDFIFSSSARPAAKELTLEFFPPPPPPPAEQTVATADAVAADGNTPGQAEAASAGNASDRADEAAPAGSVETEPPRDNATAPDEGVMDASNDTAASEAVTAGDADSPDGTESDAPTVGTAAEPAREFLSGTASLRGRISRTQRPGGSAASSEPDALSAVPGGFRVRLPIDRNATLPPQSPESIPDDNSTSSAAPETNMTWPQDSEGAESPAPNPPETKRLEVSRETRTDTNASTAEASSREDAPEATRDTPAGESGNASLGSTDEADPAPADTQQTTAVNATVDGTVAGNATEDNSTAELEELYRQAQIAAAAGDLQASRQAITAMIEHPKAPEPLREELLYNLADLAMQAGKGDLEGNFTDILEAYETAKYANPASSNVPEALYRIGYLHLSVGNLPEAKGNFDLLRRAYPDNPRVAMIDTFWGDHFLREKQYAKAADHYRYVIENFPMSPAVKPATVGLLKAFTELGFFDKAMEIVRTIEKRWPRHYLEDPSFLMAAGYAAMLSGNDDRAREYFWAYANIVPQAPDADVAMARIGDIHLKQNKPNAAREIYHRTAEAYPDREGGLIAQMRLAEEGVLDKPSIGDMAPVFDRPDANPEEIYTRILEHADSPLAPIARLKLAMWRLWNRKFPESLEDVRRFEADYPDHELLPKAREVADKALRDWIMHDLEQEDYAGIVKSWTDHRDLYTDRDPDPQTRLVVATAMMRTGKPREALEMARPFVFGSIPRGEHSEPGMELTLAMLVELQEWKDVLELARRVASWDLNAEKRRQVDYAAALANEKLNQPGQAKSLWDRLATDLGLTDTQRGYAHYFLGRAALAAGEYERATILGQEALELLKKEKDDIPKLKETLELLVQAAERRGRGQEALAWSLEYDGYVTPEDQDWPAHTYRKAILFRRNEDMKRWRETLLGLKERFPNSLYGRMAAAELEGVRIEREVEKFR